MKRAGFTIRTIASNPFHLKGNGRPTVIFRAAAVVAGMEGCDVCSIIDALTAIERDTSTAGHSDPARWLTHFAGLESAASGKKIEPWIAIECQGSPVKSTREYRKLLKAHKSECVN